MNKDYCAAIKAAKNGSGDTHYRNRRNVCCYCGADESRIAIKYNQFRPYGVVMFCTLCNKSVNDIDRLHVVRAWNTR